MELNVELFYKVNTYCSYLLCSAWNKTKSMHGRISGVIAQRPCVAPIPTRLVGWLVGCDLQHINPCRLFNAKSYLYILNIVFVKE